MPRTTPTKANRKRGAGTPSDPTIVPILTGGRYRSDQSYALAIGIAVGITIVGALALAAYLHYVRSVDLSFVFRYILAPGGLVAVSLPAIAAILRERLAPSQAGVQREVAAVKVELEKARTERASEQGGDAEKIAALQGKVANVDRIVGELVGAVRQLAISSEQTGAAVIAQRAGIDAATNAALEATGAVVHLQQSLLAAAREGAQYREQQDTEAEQRAAREAQQVEAEERARLEEAQSAHVRAAGEKLRAANAAAEAAAERARRDTATRAAEDVAEVLASGDRWWETGQQSAAPLEPLPELPAAEARPVHEQVHYFHPDWEAPATGVTPVVPPKRNPDDDTAVHTFIHTGKWPEGFSPDDPPPRRTRRTEQ